MVTIDTSTINPRYWSYTDPTNGHRQVLARLQQFLRHLLWHIWRELGLGSGLQGSKRAPNGIRYNGNIKVILMGIWGFPEMGDTLLVKIALGLFGIPSTIIYLSLKGSFQSPLLINQPFVKGHLCAPYGGFHKGYP